MSAGEPVMRIVSIVSIFRDGVDESRVVLSPEKAEPRVVSVSQHRLV